MFALVAASCASVILTSGRTDGAQEHVVASLDSAGTRSITVQASTGSELDPAVIGRVRRIRDIAWLGAFSAPIDGHNSAIRDDTNLPVRNMFASSPTPLHLPRSIPLPGKEGWSSQSALFDLGLPDKVGGISLSNGKNIDVAGELVTPSYLNFLQPLTVVPVSASDVGPISVLVITVKRPTLVSAVTRAMLPLLGTTDPTKITISTSQNLAELRGLIKEQLAASSQALVAIIFAVTAAVLAAMLYGLVLMRRKDFGRRRALGATRSLVIGLVTFQVAFLAAGGAVAGVLGSELTLAIQQQPIPGVSYATAVAVLAVIVSIAASVIPAVVAARRDPVAELRVP
ncbi:ABC transporter permease [Galbitalea soli]|uniref:Lipoprotein ABC transporter permease n=1 Tax=Galbitalea soli TaxID=1268042 RepID=A0A7C9PN42_9MICO|nr:FtsX-like permease family protein [Galbitalea soli]NEM91390.1 lipoprotein ABC transporter permease [Galbitalea soli]NYJ30081.1 putative ABC transport system permease protein [Galbitalea soli]